jgi:hypothetical protein
LECPGSPGWRPEKQSTGDVFWKIIKTLPISNLIFCEPVLHFPYIEGTPACVPNLLSISLYDFHLPPGELLLAGISAPENVLAVDSHGFIKEYIG